MTSIHPEAAAAKARADARAAERKTLKEIVRSASEQGVRFVEIQPHDYSESFGGKPMREGRMTLAYMEDGRNILFISSVICHPIDEFDKLKGRALAAISMSHGQAIRMRKPSRPGLSTKNWLRHVFNGDKH